MDKIDFAVLEYDKTKELMQGIDIGMPEKITCMVCGKRHFFDEETFFTFYGNVTIGLQGGIIGNNFKEDVTLGRISFICRCENCLLRVFKLKNENKRSILNH